MGKNILIIGTTSEPAQIGAIFARASHEMNLKVAVMDTNFNSYAPSMKTLWGRAFFKLADRRPIEWWKFNRHTVKLIEEFCPQVIVVTGIVPLTDNIFDICHRIGSKTINYLTDDPWNPWHCREKFLDNLKKYDLVVSTKTKLLSDLNKHGIKKIEYLPFGYDPYLHYQPLESYSLEKEKFDADISFIGTGDKERLPYLNAVAAIKGLKLKIYGGLWENISVGGWEKCPLVLGEQLRLATFSSKLSLGMVRKRNRDESTLRTFEIAACGGCGIYEDTSEHREIIAGYPEYGFFSSPEDLAEKCKWLLEHPLEREQMRQLGIKLLVKEANTYTARLETILQWCGKL